MARAFIDNMKMGMSLDELAAEVERRAGVTQDLVLPVEKLEAVVVKAGGGLEVRLAVAEGKKKAFRVTQNAQAQLGKYTGISLRQYWEMQVKDPELLARDINRSLKSKAGDSRLLRTVDGALRAFLSERYRGLENRDLVEAVLPVLKERDLMIASCFVSDILLYIKAVDRRIERDVPTGRRLGDGSNTRFDTISPGIVVSNSEIEEDALTIEASIWTLACTNLAIMGQAVERYHLDALLGGETRKLSAAATRSRLRDLVSLSLDKANLEADAKRLKRAAEDPVELDEAVDVVGRAGESFSLTAGEMRSVLQRFVEGEDFTRYGLHAAITRASADVADYDRATELERLGGRVIALPAAEWNPILEGLRRVPPMPRRAVS